MLGGEGFSRIDRERRNSVCNFFVELVAILEESDVPDFLRVAVPLVGEPRRDFEGAPALVNCVASVLPIAQSQSKVLRSETSAEKEKFSPVNPDMRFLSLKNVNKQNALKSQLVASCVCVCGRPWIVCAPLPT